MSIAELPTTIETVPRLGRESNGIRLSPDEFDAVEDWDELYRYELVDGVVVVNPKPSEAHVDPNEELGRLLRNYQGDHPRGGALDKTLGERYIRLPNSRRQADRVIWAGLGRTPNPKADVPTIAVEFVSKSKRDYRRDYEEKRDEYFAVGVVEYWIIDRFRRTMSVFTKADDKIVERVVAENEDYTTDLLPGFELPLAHILNLADQWSER